MIKVDDRTEEQKQTHTTLVKARDNFMSGWGQAENGYSVCAWACKPEDSQAVYRRVKARGAMRYVAIVPDTYRPPRSTAHYHIYVVGPDHPALENN
jgi:hypothetical protein